MERTTLEGDGAIVYCGDKYLFSKLKRRIENEVSNKKIKIGEPKKVKLVVIDLGVVE